MGYSVEHEITNKLLGRYTLGYMLWWRHLLWAKSQGSLFYDVEGYIENAPDTDCLKRIWDFKAKLGTRPVEILGEHTLLCSRPAYLLYRCQRLYKRAKRIITSLPYQYQRCLCRDFSRK